MKHFLLLIVLLSVGSLMAYGQQSKLSGGKSPVSNDANPTSKSSPAYAEVLLKKTELQADLESLLVEYTEDYPKIKEIRFMLELIQKESERLTSVKPSDTSKLTLALGKLIVRKVELETDMWGLQRNYKDEHPDVKRAKRKVDIYEAAIKEILG